jgi:tetratricopeptide (TPR) repeat protein
VETGLRIKSEEFQHIFQAGLRTGEIEFLEDLTQSWLLKYPNDIKVNINQSEIYISKGELEKAKQTIQSVLERDPENFRCYDLLAERTQVTDKYIHSALHALSGKTINIKDIFPWAIALRAVKNEIKRNNLQNAEKLLNRAIAEDPSNILIALEHCRIALKSNNKKSNFQLNTIYHQRWHQCISFKIWLALIKMSLGQENEAVSLLHSSAHQDPGGIVVKRLLGSSHEYLSIWPRNAEIFYQYHIPTSVAVALDWNRLQPGAPYSNHSIKNKNEKNEKYPKVKIGSKQEINNRSAMQRVYIVFSSRTLLERKYGPKSTNVIIEKLDTLAQVINKKENWESFVFLPDDFSSTTRFGLNSISEIDPWKLKLILTDLSKKLAEKRKFIGAVLIAGNDDVIPFHKLPNPTDDSDQDVLSDNPYSTTKSNYLLQEWPIGRLPGERGKDPGLLIEQIRQIVKFHSNLDSGSNIIKRVWNSFDIRRFFRELMMKPKDFGYSAEVWRRSSLAAFRPLGKGSELRISPPYDFETIDIENLIKAKCAYFNLHGLSNTPEWYGQRDFSEISSDPDFPVAISTNKISKILNNIDLVFTEACYGGLVVEKTIDESMAMKLISVGSQGLVGSTCIAYGSVFTPLIGADLLGFIFWKYTKDGYSFGESLMHAKIGLAKVMNERQGYLDGEDQKTILSFVLYGDPIGYLESNIYLEKFQDEEKSESNMNLVNDQNGVAYSSSSLNGNVTKDISDLLQSYIPGLEKAHVKIKKQKVTIQKNIDFEQNRNIQINSNLEYKNFTQLLYRKEFVSDMRQHTQYARVTMDDAGKIIKLAVSR